MPFLRALLLPSLFVLATSSVYVLSPKKAHTPTLPNSQFTTTSIGLSEQNREIPLYSFGSGPNHLLFVGGIHGGYEWNTVTLAYELIEEARSQTNRIPAHVTIDIIPNLNPDGFVHTFGTTSTTDIKPEVIDLSSKRNGRFNANSVDLNRNFDCLWEPTSAWGETTVSGGTQPFSESEALALKTYVERVKPKTVVFYHSKANAVFGSSCDGVAPTSTTKLLTLYSSAANYTSVPLFDAYPVTGDAESWLAKIGIPAITVELSSHETTDKDKNVAGFWEVVEKW